MIWPRPCAYKGAILTPAQFHRGEGITEYDVHQSDAANEVLNQMDSDSTLIIENGSSGANLATYSHST